MDIYNDIFIEYLIKKRKDAKDYLIIGGIIAAGVVYTIIMALLTIYVMLNMQVGDLGPSIGLVVIALGWYGVYLLISTRNIEYEYVLTNSAMDIDKVMSKKGRKSVVSFDFKDIDICARIDDPEHKYEYENTSGIAKTYDLTGDWKIGYVYFVDFNDENTGRTRVLFQPSSKIITTARKYNMRKVFIME